MSGGRFIINGTINDPLNVSHLLFADYALNFFFVNLTEILHLKFVLKLCWD